MATDFHSATPLKRVRWLGAARAGTHHWWLQRVTAIANVLLLLWFAAGLLWLPDLAHATVIAWIRQPFVALPLILLAVSTLWHARLGVQVMIEDYVHAEGARLAALVALGFFTVAAGATAVFSILVIALGG